MKLGIDSPIHIILIAALAGWTAIMVQKGIAIFHDGLRHKMGDFVSGTTDRNDLIKTGNSLNQRLMIWFIPFTLATGVILTHILLLPLDLLSIRSQKWWQAGLIGIIWGAVISVGVWVGHDVLGAMPINISTILIRSFDPLIFGMAIIPPVAVAYQFGRVPGMVSLLAVLVGYLLELKFAVIAINALPMVAGLLMVAFFTYRAEHQRELSGEEPIDMSFLETKEDQVSANRLWFVVQGALMATVVNVGIFSWFAHDMAAYSSGFQVQAMLAAIMISIGFLPTVVTSTAMTSVSQVVGLTFVFMVAYIAPNPIIAAVAGAVVMLFETRLLRNINNFINQAPTIREVGDSMRGAFDQISGILLMAGAFLASEKVLPGSGGYLIVGGIIGLNEMTGTPIMRMAVGPIAVLILGLIANIVYGLGVI